MTNPILAARPVPPKPAGSKPLTRNPWFAYAGRRLGHFVVSVIVLVTAAFLMVQLIPGDPAQASAGPNAPAELVEQRREELGLNLPLWLQYLQFWRGLFTGDLGESIALRIPVTDVMASRLPATLELAGLAVGVVLVVAIPSGLIAGALTRGGRRRGVELAYTSSTGVLAVIPEFLLGVVLVYLFSVSSQLLPVAGRSGPASYVLPVAALAIGSAAALSRIVRAETLTVLDNDYVRTARAKRMPAWRLYLKHVLPNLMTSTLTIAGLLLGGMIAGTVLVENIFAWPGLGMTIVQSIQGKDYPLVQVIVIFYGAVILLINLLIDIILILIDPRSALKEG
ncbi:ABC transporter permease [Saxibacter everestensis]|uniref:ABC transporter permease n=1 Tax=Saxibacter everestensis TaxID=2909229 RepID=A0ABY8QRG3_9MICO|nr:ABC transporter permease [Brevibacteriaceae bacterium ZFBP1038]